MSVLWSWVVCAKRKKGLVGRAFSKTAAWEGNELFFYFCRDIPTVYRGGLLTRGATPPSPPLKFDDDGGESDKPAGWAFFFPLTKV